MALAVSTAYGVDGGSVTVDGVRRGGPAWWDSGAERRKKKKMDGVRRGSLSMISKDFLVTEPHHQPQKKQRRKICIALLSVNLKGKQCIVCIRLAEPEMTHVPDLRTPRQPGCLQLRLE
nr:hypothetical protein Iba_chr04cCG8090 [Ipomoea batatas]